MSDVLTSDLTAEVQGSEAILLPESRADDLPALLGGTPAFAAGLPFMRPTLPSWASLAQSVRQIIATGMLTKGHYLERFEEQVARHLGVKHAVAVSSCTTGLMLATGAWAWRGKYRCPALPSWSPHGLVIGSPARFVGYVCKCGRRLRSEKKQQGVAWHCDTCQEAYDLPEILR